MIKRDELEAIAKLKGLSLRFAELDYLQDIALISIYREFGNRLVFKGGTCLYKLYQLNRFSEDLDFSATKAFKKKDFFQRLPYFFRLLNINAKVRLEQFENTTNVYLDVNGPLYDGKKETRTGLVFNISFRERIALPILRHPYIPVYPELRPFDLFAMDEKEIFAEKIRAIYLRNKARDVYDLHYLLCRKGIALDMSLINRKISNDSLKFDRSKFLNKLNEKKTSWERDLAGLVSDELLPFSQIKKEIEEKL